MPTRDAYVVVQNPDCETHEEAEVSVPPDLGVLLAWDRERRAGIYVTTTDDDSDRAQRLEELFQLWGWYASKHTSAISAMIDVERFEEVY